MRKLLSILLFLFIGNFVFGQFGNRYNVSQSIEEPSDVKSYDLDNDGYLDVLCASKNDNKITWYKNLGGGTFGVQQIIKENIDVTSVYAVDIDNDGYLDVISSSYENDKIAWYKNLGSGVFDVEKIINNADQDTYLNGINGDADEATSVYAADLNNDGFIDIVSSSFRDDKVAWYENLGAGNFSSQQIINIADTDNSESNGINGDADGANFVYAADLNNDGLIDVLSASVNDNKIAWYENLGGGIFGVQKIISTSMTQAKSTHALDIDNDGDMDVFAMSSLWASNGKIVWFENLGAGNIDTTQKIVSSSLDLVTSMFFSDLDNDGDIDILSSSFNDDKLAWYENLGGGLIDTTQNIISSNVRGANFIFAGDMDNDGDMDVYICISS